MSGHVMADVVPISSEEDPEEMADQFLSELSGPKVSKVELVDSSPTEDLAPLPTFTKTPRATSRRVSAPVMQGNIEKYTPTHKHDTVELISDGVGKRGEAVELFSDGGEKKQPKMKRPSVAAIYEIPVFKTDNKYDKRPDAGKSYLALQTDDPFGLGDLRYANPKIKGIKPPESNGTAGNLQPPAAMNRRVSCPAMSSNPSGFKTHVPGIFGKIQAKTSTRIVEEQLSDEDDDFSDLIYKPNMNKAPQVLAQRVSVPPTPEKKTPPLTSEIEKTPESSTTKTPTPESSNDITPTPVVPDGDIKRSSFSRSSSILSSDDPLEIVDQCLAELAETSPIPSISVGSPVTSPTVSPPQRVTSPASDITKPSDDVTHAPNNFSPPPQTLKPATQPSRKISAPVMAGNPVGFKTHVPGIFGKIQSKMDPSAKLIEEEDEDDLDMNFPPKFVKAKSETYIKPKTAGDGEFGKSLGAPPPMSRRVSAPAMQSRGGFKTHVPGIFNRIQAKLDSALIDEGSDSD